MRIMGVDPGYAIVGIGLLDYDNVRFSLVEYGAITTPAELPFETRLRQIYDDMTELLTRYRPDAVAMEQVMEMTRRLLHLKAVPQPDDAADALAIAICHGHNGSSRLPTAALAEIRGGNRRGRPITYKEKKP